MMFVPYKDQHGFWLFVAYGIYVAFGTVFGGGIAANRGKSLIVWRFFRTHDDMVIQEYREQEIGRCNRKIAENDEEIERLRKENLKMERIIIDLS